MRAYELTEEITNVLYHTTSVIYARVIMNTGVIKPKNMESFISFSKKPFIGDINYNEVILKINIVDIAANIMEVKYNEQWYERYTDHASYIAGEGWREQFIVPDNCYDDEGEEDRDCFELAWRDQELESFLWKKDEEEFISKVMGESIQVDSVTLFKMRERENESI